MMPQMESNQPTSEHSGSTYGRYEGSQQYAQPEYEEPRGRSPQNPALDDNFVEAVAQRMVQHLAQQGTTGKIYAPSQIHDKNVLRIIVASLAMLMLASFAILLVFVVGGTGGWISFCAACLAVLTIAGLAIDKIK